MFPAEINVINIFLISKKDIMKSPKDFKPIGFCNILYKILAKVQANRLQKILSMVIYKEQSVFVPGRNIQENILVAFKLIHYMN